MDSSCNNNGTCACKDNYGGNKCDSCIEGFFGFPNCQGISHSVWFFVKYWISITKILI